MPKNKIIISSIIGAVSLALAFSASAKVGTTAIRMRLGTHLASTTSGMHMRIASTTRMTSQQKIANIQGRSDTEISNRVNALNQLLSRVESMKNISSSDEASLSSSIQTEIANLTSLKGSIDADTSTSTIKTDFQSITESYRVYALVLPQSSIIAAADRALDLINDFNALSTKLQGYIATAQSNGTNVSSASSAMADITAKIADAGTQANAAISLVSGLQPDQGATSTLKANTAALKSAQADIKTATTDITAARKDVTTIVNIIKGSLSLSTDNSTSSTTASTTTQ